MALPDRDPTVVHGPSGISDPLDQMPKTMTAIWREKRHEVVIVCQDCSLNHTITLQDAMHTAINQIAKWHSDQHREADKKGAIPLS